MNPGPRKEKKNSLSVCHWNLNSLSAHNFSKLTQLKAYNAIYKHDFICLSETYLDSSIPDNVLDVEGYRLVRADHPNNIKRGGVCIYYKESLPVRVINIPDIKEALLLEMNYNNKKVIISVIYRSPSQSTDEFESFLLNFEQLFDDVCQRRPSLSIITGDFNARSVSWWSNDINTTEGLKLSSMSSSVGFTQLINEPTHIQSSSSSCIDLIFTDQPNLSVNCGVHASLHPNCHHQIVYSRFNLDIYYAPPYQCLIWDYKITELNELIYSTKTMYYENLAKKLNNPLLQAKTYWSILKTFYNDKKIALIPPLLINDKFVTDIQTKANIFNKFFAEQCTPLKNDSLLPLNQIFLTQSRLNSLDFNEDEIINIIRALNVNKAHGCDDISIRMIKICDKSLLKPLILLFENSIKDSCYPDIWKRSNIIPVHKKMTNDWSTITDLFLFCPFLVKYLKK